MTALLLALFACGTPTEPPIATTPPRRPANVPAQAIHIALTKHRLTVDGDAVTGFDSAELANGIHLPLLEALDGDRPVWITAPARTEWVFVRKLFLTSQEAGIREIWLGLHGSEEAFVQPEPGGRRSYNRTCKEGPLPILGVETTLSLNLHNSADGTWALGNARFQPIAKRRDIRQPIVDLPVTCWSPTTCGIFTGPAAAACEQATTAPLPPRVPIGGQQGCLSPILKELDGADRWRRALAESLGGLEVAPTMETLLMIEAQAPWTSVVAVMGAFSDGSLPSPALGGPLLEGHEGPPVCDAPIRDGAGLERAAAIWLGSQLHHR